MTKPTKEQIKAIVNNAPAKYAEFILHDKSYKFAEYIINKWEQIR